MSSPPNTFSVSSFLNFKWSSYNGLLNGFPSLKSLIPFYYCYKKGHSYYKKIPIYGRWNIEIIVFINVLNFPLNLGLILRINRWIVNYWTLSPSEISSDWQIEINQVDYLRLPLEFTLDHLRNSWLPTTWTPTYLNHKHLKLYSYNEWSLSGMIFHTKEVNLMTKRLAKFHLWTIVNRLLPRCIIYWHWLFNLFLLINWLESSILSWNELIITWTTTLERLLTWSSWSMLRRSLVNSFIINIFNIIQYI